MGSGLPRFIKGLVKLKWSTGQALSSDYKKETAPADVTLNQVRVHSRDTTGQTWTWPKPRTQEEKETAKKDKQRERREEPCT